MTVVMVIKNVILYRIKWRLKLLLFTLKLVYPVSKLRHL